MIELEESVSGNVQQFGKLGKAMGAATLGMYAFSKALHFSIRLFKTGFKENVDYIESLNVVNVLFEDQTDSVLD